MDNQKGTNQDIDQQLPPHQKPKKHLVLYLALLIAAAVLFAVSYILVRKPFSPAPVPEVQQPDSELTKEAENMPQIFRDNPPNKEIRQPGGAAEL